MLFINKSYCFDLQSIKVFSFISKKEKIAEVRDENFTIAIQPSTAISNQRSHFDPWYTSFDEVEMLSVAIKTL